MDKIRRVSIVHRALQFVRGIVSKRPHARPSGATTMVVYNRHEQYSPVHDVLGPSLPIDG